ncbi:GNAT family N-acetyltransferase [Cytobacillus purgationiresistens]|uniref:Ribosomal protein S18 acetylase RimI-like enzyme n=1 Tax=Cytobacillus purgationiresistens TaxID=863449 RepID=A0ABU0AMA9_9BACI|nr:GNAT family N-acetyltransferase [Cytobacillus purgationiresistens]MDQ0272190.1 ribosomal protein S18 acetylase RimI-like enzyme [Cytobacillus purgationiresistens]
MTSYKLVSDYRNNKELRKSFNELAKETFGIDFSGWYEKGYWGDSYIPYSYTENGNVIANASIFKMSVVINSKTYNAMQIGTVMTDQRYRNKGLAKELMLHIMELHKVSCDFMYLFANESVLDFYPKFGFSRLDESEYCLALDKSNVQRVNNTSLKRLTIEENLTLLEDYATNQYICAKQIDVRNNKNLLMFYFTIVFPEAIYYIEDLETIVLMEHEEETLHVFDIISHQKQDIETLLANIITDSTKQVVFHFTPEYLVAGMEVNTMANDDDALFILSDTPLLKGHFKFPFTSHC